MAKRSRKVDHAMTCEICGRRDPEGKTIETLMVDIGASFKLSDGRLYFLVNHCLHVRSCTDEAERMADAFAAQHLTTEDTE